MTITPEFYEERLTNASDPRTAVWDGTQEQWDRVRVESIAICREHILPGVKVLDAGCGIGELVECLPQSIEYLGVDFCPGFIDVARKRYPTYKFEVCDLLDLSRFDNSSFDWAICRTVEGVVQDQEPDAWGKVTRGLLRIASNILIFRARLELGDTLKTVKVS